MATQSPVIRAARIEREPLRLPALPRVAAAGVAPPGVLPTALPGGAPTPALAGRSERLPVGGVAPAAALAALPASSVQPAAQAAAPLASSSPTPPAPARSAADAARSAETENALRESIAAERARVLERAREQGHQAGVEQGRAEGLAQYQARLASLAKLIDSMHAALAQGIAGSEDVMVEIAFEALAKLLGGALAQREGVRAAVMQVLQQVREREHLVVRLAPRDHALLAGAGVAQKNGDAPRIELLADERVELGGCLIETAGGTLDGRLETQLQRLRDTLLSAARLSPGEGAE